MPVRYFCREQSWLLPPSLEEVIPFDHLVRFVAAFVDGLSREEWANMEIALEGEQLGAAAYHPRVSLGIWIYGFMTGVRSARKLETACREQLPYWWLTGCQVPDHNTLWRFYKANRLEMRKLLKRTVKTAVRVGLVNLAVQALDGSKIAGSAARERSCDEKRLERLLEQTEAAIKELEAQSSSECEATVAHLPASLAKAEKLKEEVLRALEEVRQEEGPKKVNLTDGDAQLVKSRGGIVAGYNAQAMVSPLDTHVAGRSGLFIIAAEVCNCPDDHAQLVPMIEKAQEMTGEEAGVTLADAGYHSGPNLAECAERGINILMPDAKGKQLKGPYHREQFVYDEATDSYICPQGQTLTARAGKSRHGRPGGRTYGGGAKQCRPCPALGKCTKDKTYGRTLEVGPYEEQLARQRDLMATPEAEALYRQRKELAEPTFGIMKELQWARRFLLRGMRNVSCEWTLLSTGFNLRTLWQVWKTWPAQKRGLLTAAPA